MGRRPGAERHHHRLRGSGAAVAIHEPPHGRSATFCAHSRAAIIRSVQNERAFDLVIFDCDGVLVDSERLVIQIEARVLSELGWPMTVEEVVQRFMGRSNDDVLNDVEARLGPDVAADFHRTMAGEVAAAFQTHLTKVDGVEELVGELHRAGIATCVASSGSHEKMRLTLGLTGLYETFDGRIFSVSDVERGKPAPDLFLHAARTMGASPANAAVVEDSVTGVRAAAAAGIACFGFAGGLTPAHELHDAGAIVFQRMSELALPLVGPR